MATPALWFERAFAGEYPLNLFPNLVSRLAGAIPRLASEGRATPAAVRARPYEGTWSVQRNLGHLADLEPLWDTRLDDFERGASVLTAADLTNRRTEERDHDGSALDGVIEEFAELRGRLVARVADWSDEALERAALHPRLKQPLRAIDLLFFVAEHDDHHLARVAWLRRELAGGT